MNINPLMQGRGGGGGSASKITDEVRILACTDPVGLAILPIQVYDVFKGLKMRSEFGGTLRFYSGTYGSLSQIISHTISANVEYQVDSFEVPTNATYFELRSTGHYSSYYFKP